MSTIMLVVELFSAVQFHGYQINLGNAKIALDACHTGVRVMENRVVALSSVSSKRVALINENGTGAYNWLFYHIKGMYWRKIGRPTTFCDILC